MLRVLCALVLMCALGASAPKTNPRVPPAPPSVVTSEPIDKATLETMDRRELGAAWNQQIAPKLYGAHVLLEKFFAGKSAAERNDVVHELEATGLDPNIVGRLARIRLYWPQLEGGAY